MHVQLCPVLWDTMDYSPPGFSVLGFSRQGYQNVLPCPSPRDVPDPEIEPASPAAPTFQADSLPLSHQGNPAITIYQALIISLNSYNNFGSILWFW